MSRRPFSVWPVIILVVGGVLTVAVATLKPDPQPHPPAAPAPLSVQVVHARPATQTLTVYSQGTVAPRREIDLVAEVSGRISAVDPHFVDGGFVVEGQPLITIDPRDYEVAVTRAEAQLADARQLLATEKGRSLQARREWRDLGNADANALFLREPQLAAAEAQARAAEANLEQARINLERTRVSVPFAGRIRQTKVDLGQYVTPGTPVAAVYDTAVAEIRLPLTDRQVALLDLPLTSAADRDRIVDRSGPEVTLLGTIAGRPHRWHGRITRTEASVDTRSRLYYAVAEVDDPFITHGNFLHDDGTAAPLIVGMFVQAEIRGRPLANVVTLPHQALFKRDHIYTVDAQQRVQEKTVEVLHTDGQRAWIRGDLAQGEAIVIGRQSLLSEGLVVAPEVAEPEMSPEILAPQSPPQPSEQPLSEVQPQPKVVTRP